VLFTSGSTGPAKGVVYTHAQLTGVRDVLAAQYGVGVATGLVAGFAPFALLGPALGARSVTPDMDVTSPKTLTAAAVAAASAAVEATVVFLSPAALVNVVATSTELTPADHEALAGVRLFLSAGAPVSERLLAEASRLMPNATAHTPYGMTEGLLMTDISLAGIREAAEAATGPGGVCVGRPAATTRVRISALDESGRAAGEPTDAPHVTGEIVVSAPHVKDHYDRLWLTNRAAEHNTVHGAAAVGTAGGIERWHRTGDVGHLDDSGRLWVEGRLPHVITTADGILTPVGPEQRIESVPAVSRAAVVGIGPIGTQQVVAIVETLVPARRVALADAELVATVRAAGTLPLAAVLVVPRLPTDIRHNSKIDRSGLAAWAARILAGGRMTRP
jgi:acyl-coenzyme A synthetase/AMP-(fatty) acid ligase